MPQPWDEPAESFEQAAGNLPLAGLLAELLAGVEAQAEAPLSADAGGEAGIAASFAAETPSGQAEPGPLGAEDLMRALAEAQTARSEAPPEELASQLLARLTEEEPGPTEAERAAAVPADETPGITVPHSPGSTELQDAAAAADEVLPPEPASPALEGLGSHSSGEPDAFPVAAATAEAAVPEVETAAAAPLALPAEAGEAASEAGESLRREPPPPEPLPWQEPASEAPEVLSAPLQAAESAFLEMGAEEPLEDSGDVGAAAIVPSAAGAPPAPQGALEPGPPEPELHLDSSPAPAEPQAAPAPGERIGLAGMTGLFAPPSEEDEFELVDAETAGKLLDQLLDAARSAIRSSLSPVSHEEAPKQEVSVPGPQARMPLPESTGPGGSTEEPAAAHHKEELPPRRHPRALSPYEGDELGQEPPPLPPAAALIGMGLPERLRARLESLGDLEKVLAAQSESAARAVDQRQRLLVFRVGSEFYGLPIEHVREVERVTRLTPVPGAPGFVRGLINLRGEILPLLDMRLLLGAPASEMPPSPRLVVAQTEEMEPPLALMVEELNGLAPVEDGSPGAAPGSADLPRGVLGSLEHRGRRVWWLDLAAVLDAAGPELGELRQ